MKKTRIVILMLIIIVLSALILIVINNKFSIIEKVYFGGQKSEDAGIEMQYDIIQLVNETDVDILLKISSNNGLEFVVTPDGTRIELNGKQKVGIDVRATIQQAYEYRVKEVGKPTTVEELIIDDDMFFISNTGGKGYQNIEIKSLGVDKSQYNISYTVGKNNPVTLNGTQGFTMLDYDIFRNNMTDESGYLPVSLTVKNSSNVVVVTDEKEYYIGDYSDSSSTITSDSLINAINEYNGRSGNVTINIGDEIYTTKIYNIDGDMDITSGDLSIGLAEDVATSSSYAQNMLILKVNGNLNINTGRTVTTYRSNYGGSKGLFVYTTGTLTNSGSISMTIRGAWAPGQNVYLWQNENGEYETVPKGGAGGAAGGSGQSGYNGRAGGTPASASSRATGGGGGGAGQYSGYRGGNGAQGTSYSGGTGGGRRTEDLMVDMVQQTADQVELDTLQIEDLKVDVALEEAQVILEELDMEMTPIIQEDMVQEDY